MCEWVIDKIVQICQLQTSTFNPKSVLTGNIKTAVTFNAFIEFELSSGLHDS